MGILMLNYYTPDPPTQIAFVGMTCFSPISGLAGLILGLTGSLPGTKKRPQ
jgi:hypothetical protein